MISKSVGKILDEFKLIEKHKFLHKIKKKMRKLSIENEELGSGKTSQEN